MRALIDNGDGTFAVPLTKGQVATVDAADRDHVGAHTWHAHQRGGIWYAYRSVGVPGTRRCRRIAMHRALLAAPDGLFVDHVNGNGLDNRRSNIRLATPSQNAMNRRVSSRNKCGLKGVSQISSGRWQALIAARGKQIYLGLYDTPEAAHAAYLAAAADMHRDFARSKS